jgi:hypothetical protein
MYPSKPICSAPLFYKDGLLIGHLERITFSSRWQQCCSFPHYSIERRAFDEKSQISLHIPHPTSHIPHPTYHIPHTTSRSIFQGKNPSPQPHKLETCVKLPRLGSDISHLQHMQADCSGPREGRIQLTKTTACSMIIGFRRKIKNSVKHVSADYLLEDFTRRPA